MPAFLRHGVRSGDDAGAGRPDSGRRPAPGARDTRPAIPRPVTPVSPEPPPPFRIDPASLPMPSLSRRRVVTIAGLLVAGLLSLGFVRQVGEATDAANRAAELRAANAALREQVTRLEADLGHVQDPRFISLQGRAYGLGSRHEIPFALGAGAPDLAEDAPGSASTRLGAPTQRPSPLDAWLSILFGPGDAAD